MCTLKKVHRKKWDEMVSNLHFTVMASWSKMCAALRKNISRPSPLYTEWKNLTMMRFNMTDLLGGKAQTNGTKTSPSSE